MNHYLFGEKDAWLRQAYSALVLLGTAIVADPFLTTPHFQVQGGCLLLGAAGCTGQAEHLHDAGRCSGIHKDNRSDKPIHVYLQLRTKVNTCL